MREQDRKHSDSFWFNNDLKNMAFMFEYCDDFLYRRYKIRGLNKIKFLDTFMRSELRAIMEAGDPCLSSQSAEDTFKVFIREDYNNDPSLFLYKQGEKRRRFKEYQLYWVGEQYAYINQMEDMSSKVLIDKLPIEFMLECYHLGHELSDDGFYRRIKWKLEEN